MIIQVLMRFFLQVIGTDILNKVMNTLKSKPKALNSI